MISRVCTSKLNPRESGLVLSVAGGRSPARGVGARPECERRGAHLLNVLTLTFDALVLGNNDLHISTNQFLSNLKNFFGMISMNSCYPYLLQLPYTHGQLVKQWAPRTQRNHLCVVSFCI